MTALVTIPSGEAGKCFLFPLPAAAADTVSQSISNASVLPLSAKMHKHSGVQCATDKAWRITEEKENTAS